MTDTIAILQHKAFWLFYMHANAKPLDDDVLRHFGTKTINGQDYAEAVISLPCGVGYSTEVAICPDLGSVNLGLRNVNSDVVTEMGWWDEARWHPHALRWIELTKLHNYWTNHLDDIHSSAAFLLLTIFVGHGVDDRPHFPERKATIRGHYKQLQLFTDAEITKLSDKTLIRPSDDDYRWTHDDELGWVFGGEYPCYTIRNREHSDGTEGAFPFSEWSTVVDQLDRDRE